MTSSVKVGKAFRIVLPAEFRELHGLSEGETLSAQLRDGELVLTPLKVRQQAIQAKYAGKLDGAIDALIAERRAEAARE
ncbi:looped-hinge helix DNA binding domain-containing protein, AbrB family [Deinococcus reticulitermitis]|uniref:Looped-hinge helix DNA binding domain-containing protein, AbrB family n=1 Tax=Deinococcus reticulitermitis TaxID=856736 RepID=A0A1H6YWT4_9DEIO|nr:AbrB/MazE/SpoVT family DNA-binding domain-containing protein [Deinococcus reticulitermitis]SEJ45631.1 looped-hinge helix DNA binding domain-containing protein, AbrB family [Deinococcus reticulitermitis]